MITYKQTHEFMLEALRIAVRNNGNSIATNGKNVLRTTINVDYEGVRVDFVNWHVIDGITLTRSLLVTNKVLNIADNLFEGLTCVNDFTRVCERFYNHYAKKENVYPKLKGKWL